MFWHEYAKIPRHTSQNAITEGDFKCILTRNCEGTEQLRKIVIANTLKKHYFIYIAFLVYKIMFLMHLILF